MQGTSNGLKISKSEGLCEGWNGAILRWLKCTETIASKTSKGQWYWNIQLQRHTSEVLRYYDRKIKSITKWSQTVNLMWMFKSSISTWVLAQLFWKLFVKSL